MKVESIAQLGQRIKETRKSQGLTQRQLSAYVGVGQRFIVELEQGKETCRVGLVLKVLDALGLETRVTERGK